MSDLIQEVDEDIRRENLKRVWNQYGSYIIALVVVVVIGVGATKWWQYNKMASQEKDGAAFVLAQELIDEGQAENALQKLGSLAKEGSEGYKTLAKFKEAQVISQTDKAKALELYQAYSADAGIEQIYQDLALYYAAHMQFSDKDNKEFSPEFKRLLEASNPWRLLAIELDALRLIRVGDKKQAAMNLRLIIEDSKSPKGLKERSDKLLSTLGKIDA